MTDQERPAPLLGIAIAVACCGAFLVGIWAPIADGLDRHFPSREVVGARGSHPTDWQIELENSSDERESVREALLSVPVAHAKRIQRFGGRLVFTHSDRLAGIRNIDQHDLLRAAGVYIPEKRTTFIGTDSEGSGQTALHEVGHMLDHALGDLSLQPTFQAIYEHVLDHGLLSTYARSSPRECFADIFERYYFSDRRRDALTTELPEAIDYLKALERPEAVEHRTN